MHVWLVVLSHPSEKYEFVSWNSYSQYMENNPNVSNHQPDVLFFDHLIFVYSSSDAVVLSILPAKVV